MSSSGLAWQVYSKSVAFDKCGWILLALMREDSRMRVKICLPFVEWSAIVCGCCIRCAAQFAFECDYLVEGPILRIPDLLTRSAHECCAIPRRVVFKEVKHVHESIEITQSQNPGRFIGYDSLKDCSRLGRSVLVAIHVITHSF
jgi:hypothetical protein